MCLHVAVTRMYILTGVNSQRSRNTIVTINRNTNVNLYFWQSNCLNNITITNGKQKSDQRKLKQYAVYFNSDNQISLLSRYGTENELGWVCWD